MDDSLKRHEITIPADPDGLFTLRLKEKSQSHFLVVRFDKEMRLVQRITEFGRSPASEHSGGQLSAADNFLFIMGVFVIGQPKQPHWFDEQEHILREYQAELTAAESAARAEGRECANCEKGEISRKVIRRHRDKILNALLAGKYPPNMVLTQPIKALWPDTIPIPAGIPRSGC